VIRTSLEEFSCGWVIISGIETLLPDTIVSPEPAFHSNCSQTAFASKQAFQAQPVNKKWLLDTSYYVFPRTGDPFVQISFICFFLVNSGLGTH